MSRFAPAQPDLFAPPAQPASAPAVPPAEPLVELEAILAQLREAEELPWPTLPEAMQEEYRVLGLARQAGPEGEALASKIFNETERLLAMTD
jgi:hypothetical protein